VLVGHNFGQREHLALILLAPYAVIRAGLPPARPGRWFRLTIGVAAGLGMALKPFFAFILIGIEGALLLRRGARGWSLGFETAAVLIASGLCAAATVLFAPEYLREVVPLARATYQGFEGPVLEILVTSMGPRTLGCFLLALLAIPLAWRAEPRSADLVALLLGAGLGGYASFLTQAKGWIYQLMPALAFFSAAFAVAAAARARHAVASRRPVAARAAFASAVAIVAIAAAADLARSYGSDARLRRSYASLIETIAEEAQGGPALFLSLEVEYTFPAVNYAGAAYPYRWHHLLPVPGLYRDFVPGADGRSFRSPEQMGPIERAFFESFIDDALAHPPRVILIDRRPPARTGLAPDLDLLAYFCQSARFAELVAAYGWLGRRASYDVLTPRTPQPGAAAPCVARPPSFDPEPSSHSGLVKAG
jgi:hypothetical protein